MVEVEAPQHRYSLPYVKELPQKRQRRFAIYLCVALLDLLSIQLGTSIGIAAYHVLFGSYQLHPFLAEELCAEYTLLFVFFSSGRESYGHAHHLMNIKATADILRVSVLCLVLLGLSIFFGHHIMPRMMLFLIWTFTTSLLLVQKHFSRELVVSWKARQVQRVNAVVIGAGQEARRIFSILTHSPDLGLCPVALVVEGEEPSEDLVYTHGYVARDPAPVLRERVEAELLQRYDAKEIYVADPALSDSRMRELISLGHELNIPVSFVGNKAFPDLSLTSVRFLDGLHVTSSLLTEQRDIIYSTAKRCLDVLVSGLLILVTSPLWAVVAVWVLLSSKGPVLFRQTRIGQEGRPFEMLKFRSMYTSASSYDVSPQSSEDPRITSAGRFLRKTSLDELPQLLNVLRGDMSLVGPRPEMPFIVRGYSATEQQRLLVPQGMTGIWQLSADRKLAIHERLEYDLYYLSHRDFYFDLAILMHTALFAAKGV